MQEYAGAEAVERAYRTQLAKGEVGLGEEKFEAGFAESMREFLEWVQFEHRAKPNTVLSHLSTSKHLIAYFKEKALGAISAGEVEDYKRWCSAQKCKPRTVSKKGPPKPTNPFSPATINRELALLKKFFNHQIKKNVVGQNPVSQVKMLREAGPKDRILSEDEERLYLLAANQPF
ncbi:MAG TPA: phage integrase SAM-like domain-containing protein [Aridibacter sp.]|nr:phage integrase SAM-like domain-containing protein [Aridibacter sp.]